jgi:hypothetical protein
MTCTAFLTGVLFFEPVLFPYLRVACEAKGESKVVCKDDEYFETSIGSCRPCSIPCGINNEVGESLGCTCKGE